jgi:excisionase family DNA binding protein
VRQRFSALARCARLRDGEARSPWEAAGAGVGPSRSRHRPPSSWTIESSPVPAAERKVPGAAEADGHQHTSEAEVASCWRSHRRRAASGAVEAESGIGRRVSELGRVQNRHLKIPIHYEGGLTFLEMKGGFMRLIDSEALASWLGVEIVFVRRLVAERRIPFLKIGKFVRFDPDEVAMWIDDQRIAALRAGSHRSGRW